MLIHVDSDLGCRRKFRSPTSDNMDEAAEVGTVREEKESEETPGQM